MAGSSSRSQGRQSGHYHDDSMSSSAHPPSYQDGYAEDYSGGSFADDKQAHAHGLSAGQYDSSRSIADGDRYDDGMHLTPGAAGVGAGARAYGGDESDYAAGPAADRTTLSSPSMYTDPFEYSSTAPPPNVTSTRPPSSFLTCDPYARGNTRGATNLARADTLRPNDSVSAYNVPAPSIVGGAAAHGMGAYTPYGNAGGKYDSADVDPERDAYDYGHAHGGYGESAADLPLTGHASGMGYAEDEEDEAKQLGLAHSGARDKDGATLFANQTGPPPPRKSFEDEEDRNGLLGRLSRKDSVEAQIEKRRKGIGRQRWPFFSWLLALAFTIVFIVELIKSSSETGQAVQTKPSVSPMLGPPSEFLIAFGARFVPCMRTLPASSSLTVSTQLPCLNATTLDTTTYTQSQLCPISEICGLSDPTKPNQSYRFVSAIFLHAGFIHIIFNLLVQLTLCCQIEKLIGSPAYILVYFAGGIGGNLLGGNFGLVGQPAVGASGSIYTCISLELVDLIYNWRYEYKPKTRLTVSIVFAIIGLAIGLLPGLDNFSHIGGFAVGILGGLLFAPAIHATKRHRVITWVLRVIALGLLVGFFVGLVTNFYNSEDPIQACTWCRYLSCLPVFKQCKGNGLTYTSSTTSSNN